MKFTSFITNQIYQISTPKRGVTERAWLNHITLLYLIITVYRFLLLC